MNKGEAILPDSIAIFDHLAAFDLMAKQWIDELQMEVLLVYVVDNVDARALPILAQQFDVLGYKGWKLAQTDADRRALIKRAIELKRYAGTPWSVIEAMKAVGFIDLVVEEHTSGHWANFSVRLLNENVGITEESITDLHQMIKIYKGARNNLVQVYIDTEVTDVITIEDDAEMVGNLGLDDDVRLSSALFYDGTGDYDGTYDHSGDSDLITFEPL